jgi:hypothetical protein
MTGAPEELRNKKSSSWQAQRTRNLRMKFTDKPQELRDAVRAVFRCMDEHAINMPILLAAISPELGDEELLQDSKLTDHRTMLLVSDDLPELLHVWHHRPQKHNKGKKKLAGGDNLSRFALEATHKILEREKLAWSGAYHGIW